MIKEEDVGLAKGDRHGCLNQKMQAEFATNTHCS